MRPCVIIYFYICRFCKHFNEARVQEVGNAVAEQGISLLDVLHLGAIVILFDSQLHNFISMLPNTTSLMTSYWFLIANVVRKDIHFMLSSFWYCRTFSNELFQTFFHLVMFTAANQDMKRPLKIIVKNYCKVLVIRFSSCFV